MLEVLSWHLSQQRRNLLNRIPIPAAKTRSRSNFRIVIIAKCKKSQHGIYRRKTVFVIKLRLVFF
jgi:hypothetical protein